MGRQSAATPVAHTAPRAVPAGPAARRARLDGYGEDDLDASPAWLQRVARQRLGIEARGLPGGHSPFLARPAARADLLEAATAETGAPAG